MNVQEHEARASRLLSRAMLSDDDVESGYEGELAAAQVHATLALVAAVREVGELLSAASRPAAPPAPTRCASWAIGGFQCERGPGHTGEHLYDASDD